MRKENFLLRIDKSLLEDFYINKLFSIEKISKELGVCSESIKKALNYYNLSRDPNIVRSKSLLNSELKHSKYNEIKERISKEDIYNYYVVENHTYEETPLHFNITSSCFDKLCKDYNIRKDRSKIYKSCLGDKYEKYGSKQEYYRQLIEKSKNTRIQNCGSVEESYRLGFEKIKKTNFEKYGVECILNSPILQDLTKKKYSNPNNIFANLLEINNLSFDREFNLELKSYDFKVGNTLIEINPTITHNSSWSPYRDHKGLNPKYHLEKSSLAKRNNYRCIHIWDWDDEEKIIKSLICSQIIYARKCIIKEVSKKDTKIFLDKYHFQNNCRNQIIRLGLYYNDDLILIMTFGKPRYNKKYEYELLRLCTKSGIRVVGGSKKLFTYFINNYSPKSIISYCDNSKFNGEIYSALGMSLKNLGVPTIHWYNPNLNIHITDNLLRQQGFDRLLGDKLKITYGKGTSNEELITQYGFLCIYDCGQSLYEWKC